MPPEAPKRVKVRISSDPEGARVVDADGAVFGLTPVEVELPAVGVVRVTLNKDGYDDRELSLDPEKSLMWAVALAKSAPKADAPKRRATSGRANKHKGKKRNTPAKGSTKPAPSGKTGFGTF